MFSRRGFQRRIVDIEFQGLELGRVSDGSFATTQVATPLNKSAPMLTLVLTSDDQPCRLRRLSRDQSGAIVSQLSYGFDLSLRAIRLGELAVTRVSELSRSPYLLNGPSRHSGATSTSYP